MMISPMMAASQSILGLELLNILFCSGVRFWFFLNI